MSLGEERPQPRYRVTASGTTVGIYSRGLEAMASLPESESGRAGFEIMAEIVDWGDRKQGAKEQDPEIIERRRIFP